MAGILEQRKRRDHRRSETDAPGRFIAETYYKQATALLTRGVYAESEKYLREALRVCPEHAGAWNNLGTAVWQQGRVEEAETCYRRGLSLEPEDHGILNNLGNALWQQGKPDEAVPYYRQALASCPDTPETLMNLGVALSDVGKFDEAMDRIRDSLRLRPDSPEAIDNLGMTLARQGRWDEAMACYEQALRLHPDFPEARRNRAYAWLARGDYERGWPEYEWRLRCRNHVGLTANRPRWNGEDLAGRTILLHAEQGFGDTLQFIRFATMVQDRGGRVMVWCPNPLIRLVAGCPGVDHVLTPSEPLPDFQVHCPLMSLPAVLGTRMDTLPNGVPYLSADTETTERWRPIVERCVSGTNHGETAHKTGPSRVLKIGIAWQGNPRNRIDRWRSLPLRHFAHLARLPGVRLISLQKGDGTEQIAELAGRFPVAEFHDASAGDGLHRRDFLDTAAIMRHLDLVVTLESAVAHLAGALGVRVWVALAAVADWRWLMDRDDSPWYPTMTLFRQSEPGDWDGVFRRIARDISDRFLGRAPIEPQEIGDFAGRDRRS
ncbi:MAG: tetratricopeptide repeat protein [Isosphaeraceae bacterium]